MWHRPKSFSECPLDALLMEVVEEQQMLAEEEHFTLSTWLIRLTRLLLRQSGRGEGG